MSHRPRFTRGGIRVPLLTALILILVLLFIGLKLKPSNPSLENRVRNMVQELETLSRMRVAMLKSVDVEKAAVMADTDELSRALADESLRAAEAVERDQLALKQMIEIDHVEKEMNLLSEFKNCWVELRKIDKVLLEFAVENSNIKAAKLSFDKGTQVISHFRQDLTDLVQRSSTNPNYNRLQRLACEALAAGFEVHYLHAPHIAASNDMEMDRIESEITQLNTLIKSSLKEMEKYLSNDNQPLLQNAVSAYDDFDRITAEVLRLSRQNTNIKSYELSLGKKRKVTAQCDETLVSLMESIRSRTFEATR